MDKEFISIGEACHRFSISRTKLNDLMREVAITRHKLGRRTLVDPTELSNFIRNGAIDA
jgi:excisionase family DNA binding protein